MRDDLRLARRIQQGEMRAFEEFVDSYGARVSRLARRYADNPADVEDLTQEIFVALYRSIGSFRGDSALSTWVYRVAVNICLKRRQRARPDCVPFDEALGSEADWQADPARSAERRELSDRVQAALEILSPLHRDVVILHELHGLTYQECASVLHLPVGTVKSRLSNAFRRLREQLGGYVTEPCATTAPEALGETSR